MSADTTVTVTRTEDGTYTAVDAETGAFGEGESKIDALADLLELLRAFRKIENASSKLDSETTAEKLDSTESNRDPIERYERLSSRIQTRVREEEIDEDVVEEAIEWARTAQ